MSVLSVCRQLRKLPKIVGKNVRMDVYDNSQHAIDFYKHKGYVVVERKER